MTLELSDEAADKFERSRPEYEQFFADYILRGDDPRMSMKDNVLRRWRAHRAWATRNQARLGYTEADVDAVLNAP